MLYEVITGVNQGGSFLVLLALCDVLPETQQELNVSPQVLLAFAFGA